MCTPDVPHVSQGRTSKKRAREITADVTSGRPADAKRQCTTKLAEKVCGPVGISKSAEASRKLKAAMQNGALQENAIRKGSYKTGCLTMDFGAQFDFGRVWKVFHSRCGRWVTMKEAYDRTRFRQRVTRCNAAIASRSKPRVVTATQACPPVPTVTAKCQSATPQTLRPAETPTVVKAVRQAAPRPSFSRLTTLDAWFPAKTKPAGQDSSETIKTLSSDASSVGSLGEKMEDESEDTVTEDEEELERSLCVPCHGITQAHESRIPTYLTRTGAIGGGARSVTALSNERYGCKYKALNEQQKRIIDRGQQNEHKWRNDFSALAVFSTSRLKNVRLQDRSAVLPATQQSNSSGALVTSEDEPICAKCQEVLKSSAFQQALRVPTPASTNYKYLKRKHHNETPARLCMKVAGLQDLLQDKV